jgi:hypothetical protein
MHAQDCQNANIVKEKTKCIGTTKNISIAKSCIGVCHRALTTRSRYYVSKHLHPAAFKSARVLAETNRLIFQRPRAATIALGTHLEPH